MQVQSLDWENPLEKEMATHSSILFFFFYTPVFLPGKSHGQRSLASYIQSMGLQKVGHDLVTKQRQQQPYVLAILLLDIEVKEMKTLS